MEFPVSTLVNVISRLGICGLAIAFQLFAIFINSIASADDTKGIVERYRDVTAYITVEVTNRYGRPVYLNNSSGVVVGRDGLILTVFHAVDYKLSRAEGETLSFYVSLGSRSSKPFEAEVYPASIPNSIFGMMRQVDVMLLRSVSPLRSDPPKVCDFREELGSPIFNLGFPLTREFSAFEGTYINDSGEDGRLLTTLPLNPGLSGGPVFNSNGELVGIAHSGDQYENTDGINVPAQLMTYVTPIQQASFLLELAEIDLSCNSETDISPLPLDDGTSAESLNDSLSSLSLNDTASSQPPNVHTSVHQIEEYARSRPSLDPLRFFERQTESRSLSFPADDGKKIVSYEIVPKSTSRVDVTSAYISDDGSSLAISLLFQTEFGGTSWFRGEIRLLQVPCYQEC